MNTRKVVKSKRAVARLVMVFILIAIIAVAAIGTVLAMRYYADIRLSASLSPTPSPTSSPTISPTSSPVNSPVEIATPPPVTPSPTPEVTIPPATNTSMFEPVANFGNGTWQFEGNNLHVYNYTWDGYVATFNVTVKGMVIVPPTLCDGLLLVDVSNVTAMTGGVVAINMQNGQIAWTTPLPNMMMTQPLTYEGLVIIGLGNNAANLETSDTVRGAGTNGVYALNFSTGEIVWSYSTFGEDMPTPVIYNGLVVFTNGDGGVYALNALTGNQEWVTVLGEGVFVSMSSSALLGDSIFFGQNNPYAFDCVNLTDGQVSWSTPIPATGGLDDCSPVIWNNTVISGYTVTASNGLLEPVLFGVNATNGQVLWQFNESLGPQPAGGELFTTVSVWNGIVYSDSPENGTLYAIDASSGMQLWNFTTGPATCNANVFNGNLWIVNSKGTLFVLDPTLGTLITSTQVGVLVSDGNLVFVGQYVIIWGSNQVVCMPVSNIFPTG